jgi:hypothetical protein
MLHYLVWGWGDKDNVVHRFNEIIAENFPNHGKDKAIHVTRHIRL